MAEPNKYYADDKAILDEMIRLEKEKEEALAMGLLGAGTIGLDAAGLKALGTMGRIGTRTTLPEVSANMKEYDKITEGIQDKMISEARLSDSEDLENLYKSIRRERHFSDVSDPRILTNSGEVPMIGSKEQYRNVTDQRLQDMYDQKSNLFRQLPLEEQKRFQNYLRNKNVEDMTNKLLQQQQRGYGELAAATIPFVGGADMMYSAYQDYVNAQNQIEKMMKQATPEQRSEFEKKLKEERMKPYQLKDSDFRYK